MEGEKGGKYSFIAQPDPLLFNLFAVRVKMAESGDNSGWSSEVSFMDLPMCACVLEQTLNSRC